MQLRGTYFHDHEYVFICLDDMIKLTNMLMTKVLQSLYFTLDSRQVRLNNTVKKMVLIIIKNLAHLTHSDLHCCEQSKAHYSLGLLLLLLLLHCIITQIIIIIKNNNYNNTDKKNLNNGQKGKPDILQIHQKGVYLRLSSFAYF